MKRKSKNLIVIIGNGFDLAHGLETRYDQFANYYLEKITSEIDICFEKGKSSILSHEFYRFLFEQNLPNYQISDNSTIEQKKIFIAKKIQQNEEKTILDFLKKDNKFIINIISNSFLGKLYANSYKNWFDIEQAYYEELKNIFIKKDKNQKKNIIKLNNELNEIKTELEKYLINKVEPSIDKSVYYSFTQHFKDRKKISFINFNYTNTVKKYLDIRLDSDLLEFNLNLKNIHIHNELNNNIIFGYGDDTDNIYQEMKMSMEKEFLRNFKTFEYLKTKNYKLVLNELSTFKDGYDVLIIGHSLGMTDKTILKTILDSNSCHHIELLKRSDLKTEKEKEEHLFELYASLSRIFNSEASLREKVIPFEWSLNFPIMTSEETSKLYDREENFYPKVYK